MIPLRFVEACAIETWQGASTGRRPVAIRSSVKLRAFFGKFLKSMAIHSFQKDIADFTRLGDQL